MSQQSGQRGQRQDDQLRHETQGLEKAGHSTRAEEWRDPEPSGEDQPDVISGSGAQMRHDPASGPSPRQVEDRSELGRNLSPSAFPGDRDQLLASARDNNAPDDVLEALRSLPEGRTWQTVQEVAQQLGIVE